MFVNRSRLLLLGVATSALAIISYFLWKKKKRTSCPRTQTGMLNSAKYLEYPFIQDETTISYIAKANTLFVMRGAPGSGKSTVARAIKCLYESKGCSVVYCSADNYFIQDDGQYMHDVSKLPEAHAWCREKTEKACEAGINVVIVDNTNIKRWEVRNYTKIARQFSYSVILVEAQTPWKYNSAVLQIRNTHSVPVEVIEKKLKDFEIMYPLYFGWFLDKTESKDLHKVGQHCFKMCLENVQEFKRDLSVEDESHALNHYYDGLPEQVHCTAKFCGYGEASYPKTNRYSKQEAVKQAMYQITKLHVIGLIITPRTLGARIKLTEEQLMVWDNEPQTDGLETTEDLADSLKNLGLGESSQHAAGRGKKLEKNAPKGKKMFDFTPTKGFGSRAHITLGCSEGTRPVQTGYDLLDIIKLEQNSTGKDFQCIAIPEGYIRYYGDGQCVIYFNKAKQYNAIFQEGFY